MYARALAAALLLVHSAGAAPPEPLRLEDARPGQMQVGGDAVRAVMKAFVSGALQDAGLDPGPLDLERLSANQAARWAPAVAAAFERARLEPANVVRATRSPAGVVHLTDGHHRATAMQLLRERGLLPADARILVQFPEGADFAGRSAAEFEAYLAAKAYFTPEVRAELASGRLTPRGALDRLPRTFAELARPAADLPLRSTIGLVFLECAQRLKAAQKARGGKGELVPEARAVSGEAFEDYLEFKLGEAIACEVGSEGGEGRYNSDAVMERARRALFTDPKNLALLRRLAGPDSGLAEKQIANSLRCYEEIQAERRRAHRPPPPPSACEVGRALRSAMDQVGRGLESLKLWLTFPGPCPDRPGR